MSFASMKLSTRFFSVFSLVAVAMGIVGVYGLIALSNMADTTEKLYKHPFAVAVAITAADGDLVRLYRHIDKIILSTDAAVIEKHLNEVARLDKKMDQDLGIVNERFLGDKTILAGLFSDLSQWKAVRGKILDAKKAGKHDEALKIVNEQGIDRRNALLNDIQYIVEYSQSKARDFDQNAKSGANQAITFLIASIVVALASVLAAGAWLLRGLMRQLGGEPTYATAIAGNIAGGDLACEITTAKGDQQSLLFAMKSMRDSLSNIVNQVRSGTETIATASAEVANGNMDLSSRTESQASSLEETASSMEELTSTVKQNADNASQANALAASASAVATRGGTVVSEVVNTMESINASSKKIVDIISVIDGIAFQTNILALNAAVEAARAGEQGRGFAVVASEVRNLAQRSAAAAKEIKALISDSVEKVDEGSKLVNQAGSTMYEIVESIHRVTEIMGEITAASAEQISGIEQVNHAIMQMDSNTQQNSALVEQAAAATHSMREQSDNLLQIVSVFKLDRRYAAHGGSPAKAALPRPMAKKSPNDTRTALTKPAPAAKRSAPQRPTPSSKKAAPAEYDWEEF
jgi:methyl-accepting chemotaxis protein